MDKELWNKIIQFDLDHPVGEYDFSTRLAKENFWTKDFTEQAILEYKKFMYLAASSDYMVSPSGIVDIVWHQHLIFTQLYQDFCTLIGKQVQHVPSTHNKEDLQKFKLAKERTARLYESHFGKQPTAIWNYDSMYDSLNLKKARLKIRTFIIIGMLSFIALTVPFYFLLKPLYVYIDNPYFLLGYFSLIVITLGTLELYNMKKLTQITDLFDKQSFIYRLRPYELVYMKTEKLSNVINGVINDLIENRIIRINQDQTLELVKKSATGSKERQQVINVSGELGKRHYPTLLKQLILKPIFSNTSGCINAFRKYFNKSHAFGKLFYFNFGMLSLLMMLGIIRLATGILRDKPITLITVLLIVLIIFFIMYLTRLTRLACTTTIPDIYKQKIIVAKQAKEDWEWRYFIFGQNVLNASFIPLVTHVERNNQGSSSCGTSCGSSCGSSCSSCGGCGGD